MPLHDGTDHRPNAKSAASRMEQQYGLFSGAKTKARHAAIACGEAHGDNLSQSCKRLNLNQPRLHALVDAMNCFEADYATACAFRFLRQPSRPNPPRPVAKSGSAAGSGVSTGAKL